MATVVDTLFLELGVDTSKFSSGAKKASAELGKMEESFDETRMAMLRNQIQLEVLSDEYDELEKELRDAQKEQKKFQEQQKKQASWNVKVSKTFHLLGKGMATFIALATGSNAFVKITNEAAQANVQLNNVSKNIGMSGEKLTKWGHMAQMAGGNSQAMTQTLANLSLGITKLTVMGDTSLVPFFNAFSVALLDNNGKARDLDKVMLDLADRFEKMDRTKAYGLAKSMGFDDDTINTLMLGRAEMQEMLDLQKNLYKSSEQDIKASRELTKAKGLLSAQYESLKLRIGNALLPVLTRLVRIASGFVDFLNAHEHQVKNFFMGMATVIGLVLLPMLFKAGLAMLAFVAPVLSVIAVVGALGAAFGLLYDDYATWAKGGKSLFDWGKFSDYIKNSRFSVDNLKSAFVYLLTGYKSWADVYNNAINWLKQKGFIDESGVSVNSLATGFKNLAKDLIDYVTPALRDVAELFNALKNGDFQAAAEIGKRLGQRGLNVGISLYDTINSRVTGAIDTALGHDPKDPNSLQSRHKDVVSFLRDKAGLPNNEVAKKTVTNIARHVGWELGDTSKKYESRGGVGTISTGRGDKGGKSYGQYQFAINMGVPQDFVRSTEYGRKHFAGLSVGSAEFDKKWKALAQSDTVNFKKAQHDYTKSRYFDKQISFLKSKGVDLSGRGAGVLDMVWSTAVQYGGHTNLIKSALVGKNVNHMSDADIINAVQGYKSANVPKLFKSSPTLWGGLRKRAESERHDLLKLSNKSVTYTEPLNNVKVSQALQQSQTLQQQAATQSHQKNLTVQINGGVNVQTSANHINGVMGDASQAIRDRLTQIVPAMW